MYYKWHNNNYNNNDMNVPLCVLAFSSVQKNVSRSQRGYCSPAREANTHESIAKTYKLSEKRNCSPGSELCSWRWEVEEERHILENDRKQHTVFEHFTSLNVSQKLKTANWLAKSSRKEIR